MFNFSSTESAKGLSYITPGVYPLKPTKVELGKFPNKGTSYLGVTFENEEGQSLTEKFVLTEKAIGRLQYLHESMFGKKLDKDFDSEAAVEKYFRKALTGREIVKNFIVGGEIAQDGNVYAVLGYTNFIDVEEELEVGEFEEGSAEYKKYVKRRTGNGEVSDKASNGLLNSEDDEDDVTPPATPAKKDKAKSGAKTPATAPAGKKGGKTPVETPAEENDDEDMPW